MKSMCCLCIQFTHENTSERTILHLVKKRPPLQGMVACTAKKASYAPVVLYFFLHSSHHHVTEKLTCSRHGIAEKLLNWH